jgi:hypothetical protein
MTYTNKMFICPMTGDIPEKLKFRLVATEELHGNKLLSKFAQILP